MDIGSYNRWAWDQQVQKGNRWTVPASREAIEEARAGRWRIVLTPTREVPQAWLGDVRGKRILCLAGGGGQQAPVLAAAGATVTTLDNSPRQLERDQEVALRERLQLEGVLGDMRRMPMFEEGRFDAIVHPCSNGFVDEILVVWKECYRVLRPGGTLIAGFTNPLFYIFDFDAMEQGKLEVRHAIPYADPTSLTAVEQEKLREDGEPFIFGHTLEDQIGGQTAAGFTIQDLFEDRCSEGAAALLSQFICPFVATKAGKPDDRGQ